MRKRRISACLRADDVLLSAIRLADQEFLLPDGQRVVGIREFITSPDYLDKGEAFWPGIIEDLEAMTGDGIIGAIIEQGIGGGKSYRFSAMICYQLYKLKMLEMLGQDLRKQAGMDKDMDIDLVNVSVTATQAKDVVFGYVSKFIDNSPWFLEYMRPDPVIRSRLRFDGYNVFPGHSKDTSVIGRNLHTALFDEANFFEKVSQQENREHAAAILFDAISSRIRSRFGLHGFLGICSSRKIVSDFTRLKIEALKQSDLADRFYLPDARPVWDLWPDDRKHGEEWKPFVVDSMQWDSAGQQYDSIPEGRTILPGRVWVPKRYWGDFDSNPEASLRDHASMPADAFSPFFRKVSAIVPDFGDEENPPLQNPIRPGIRAEDWCVDNPNFNDFFEDWFRGIPGTLYHFHYDPSKNSDASGLVVSHVSGQVEATDHTEEELSDKDLARTPAYTVDVDCIVQIRAPKGGEIPQSVFRKIVIFLRDERGFSFGQSSSDSWNSLDGHQQMRAVGFRIEVLSMDRDRRAYETLKTVLYDNRLFFPPAKNQNRDTTPEQLRLMAKQGDSSAVLQVELKELEDIKGQKIDHPAKGSKDLADALAGSVFQSLAALSPSLKKRT